MARTSGYLLRNMTTNNHVIKVDGSYQAIIDEVDEVNEVGELHRTSSVGSEENSTLNLSYSKDLKNTSPTSSTSSVDDPSQLHLPVNREKYPDNEGYRRALMDKMTTEEMERIVRGNGNLNGHAHKTE